MFEQLHSKSNEDFTRSDGNQGALINTNNSALEDYRKIKKRYQKLNTIDQLTDKVNAIELMLHQILEKLK